MICVAVEQSNLLVIYEYFLLLGFQYAAAKELTPSKQRTRTKKQSSRSIHNSNPLLRRHVYMMISRSRIDPVIDG